MNETIDKLKELLENDKKTIEENYKEIERLNSIIKEVRKYIKNIPDDEFVESEHFIELLEILDKVNNVRIDNQNTR